ncbi:MAG: hypothetical protein N4A45_10350 [Flavobacteriales bacterium]|jgi:hypothetical protein|nr:hypothetical protein [Flavobacteriales bacterium]
MTLSVSKLILKNEFETLRVDLIQKHDELKMRASGRWAKGLEVEVQRDSATLWGLDYTNKLIHGQAPGIMPSPKKIEQWMKDKGIQARNPSMLAYIIAKKIEREGTRYFRKGGTDLVDSVITPQRIQQILDKVSHANVDEFVHLSKQIFKEIA